MKLERDRFPPISGSHIIDKELHILIHFIIRDFIVVWYKEISDDPDLLEQIGDNLIAALTSLSHRSVFEGLVTTVLPLFIVYKLSYFGSY